MNFYNPYGVPLNGFGNFYMPTAMPAARTGGLFSRLFGGGINWSSIFNNTQKTLNFINQAIPVVKQATPLVKNARTMFRVMNEFRKSTNQSVNNPPQTSTYQTNNINEQSQKTYSDKVNNVGPTFFA